MKSGFPIFLALILLSVGAAADRPDLNKYTDAELWDLADLVALVRVVNGEYTKDVGFDLSAKPVMVLKGRSKSSIAIAAHYPLLNAPDQLGATYLVFLLEASAGSYVLVHEIRSSVKIGYFGLDDDISDRMTALSPSKEDKDWYSLDDALWVLECSPTIGPICLAERSVVAYAMDRLGGIKGE